MASIDSMSFDQAAYTPGEVMTLTVGYIPDTPGVTPETFTATAVITNSAGTVVANSSAPFTVNQVVAGGDVVSVTDSGDRTWTPGTNSGSVALFTATA